MGATWIDAWLLRTYLTRHPAEAENILAVTGTFAAGAAMRADDLPWFGQTVASVVAWDVSRFDIVSGDADGPLGEVLPDFDPEAGRTISLRVELPYRFFAEPAQRLAEFLRDAHAPVTLSHSGDTTVFTAAQKSLRKRMLLGGTCRASEAGTTFELQIGSRPFLRGWLESFGEPQSARQAMVQILALW